MVPSWANFLRQILALFLLAGFLILPSVRAENATSQLTAGNAIPTISNIKINNNTPITLTANATTSVVVSYTVTDNNSCGEVFFGSGGATTTLFRSSTTAPCTASYNNCYIVSSFTSHSCPNATSASLSADATTTFQVYYFADATDASSSYPAQDWRAYIEVRDINGSSSATSTPSGVELNTLVAVNPGTSTLGYGTIAAGSNTGATNQEMQIYNVGNASTSLQMSGTAMCSGGTCLATSSQHYATSTFTYGGAEQLLSAAAQTVSGWLTNFGPQIRSWQNTTALPSAVESFAVLSNKNFIYSIGGYVEGFTYTSTVRFASVNATGSIGAWQNTTALPNTLSQHSSVLENGYVYAIGGSGTGFVYTSTVRFASVNATGSIGAWQNTTALPSSVRGSPSVAKDGSVYAIGGEDISGSTSTVLCSTISSSGTLGSWQNATALPAGRRKSGVAIKDDKIYVTGGYVEDYPFQTSSVIFSSITGPCTLGSWQNTTALPELNQSHGAVFSGNNLYIIGGENGGPPINTAISTVYYSPVGSSGHLGSWQSALSLPDALTRHGAVIVNGYLYIVGGGKDNGGTLTSTVMYASLNSRSLYWGLGMPDGTPANLSFSGQTTLTAVFAP